MTRAEKARRIERILNRVHPQPDIPLEHRDPYQLLVAVVLSAQCTDERVNRVTPGLFARASTPFEMAELRVSEIRSLIRSCGLAPTKARNLKALSQMLVAEHDGRVPRELDALEALPGVGHKTAGVVRVQAFGEPEFPVDTHIHRLARRWGLSRGRSVVHTERDLKKLFPPERWGSVHLQLIYFGRSHCPALAHDFDACPVCSWAASRAERRREASRRARSSPTGARRRSPGTTPAGARPRSR